MAESKASISSKGTTNVLAKRVQKQFNRAQEKVLQRLGKSEETKDEHFEQSVMNLHLQQSDGYRIYKDLKAYLNAVTVMRDASSRLFQSLFDAYDERWDGGQDLGEVVEGEDLLWKDYESKLHDQALITMESYMSQFPDVRERVAKRNRKLVDYDSARHHLTVLQNAKKKDDVKIGKAEDEMKAAKMIFEEMNRELKVELPVLFDSRIGCYVTVFQSICNLRDIFYKEISTNNEVLQTVMKELSAQHPDKSFVVKNFNRSGSLKRRSFRDTLSPRSLRSFYDFHMSMNPRGSLRRENSSSFRSDRSTYGSYNPKPASPTGPRPLYENVSDAKSSPKKIDYPSEEEDTPSNQPRVEEASTSEDTPEVEDKNKKKDEPSQASNQDGQEEDGSEEESSDEDTDGGELKTSSTPAQCSKDHKSPGEVENVEPSGVENGVDCDAKIKEENETSSHAPKKDEHPSGEVKTEAPK
ncbi:hypothetical protein DNTS_005011 [Danionella cerebrum]|uniref:BAR domain-containing protein n=1 Tax=Danionella cerebrum TaxID=2873325 RepID=A0A553Q9Q7_9TELE|nr:hypothetical protein DNTS_005011 [Danionella translucida]TRY86661.1 hypothetical protein DNTS_005011 [Danionella translucida]